MAYAQQRCKLDLQLSAIYSRVYIWWVTGTEPIDIFLHKIRKISGNWREVVSLLGWFRCMKLLGDSMSSFFSGDGREMILREEKVRHDEL